MRSIRRFEEHLLELFETGLLNGTTHACIGQEAPTALRLWSTWTRRTTCSPTTAATVNYLARTGDAGLLVKLWWSGRTTKRSRFALDDLAREGARRMIAAALRAEVDECVDQFAGKVDEDGRQLVAATAARGSAR